MVFKKANCGKLVQVYNPFAIKSKAQSIRCVINLARNLREISLQYEVQPYVNWLYNMPDLNFYKLTNNAERRELDDPRVVSTMKVTSVTIPTGSTYLAKGSQSFHYACACFELLCTTQWYVRILYKPQAQVS